MKTTLRVRFMQWLTLQTVLVLATVAVVLVLFNLHERGENPAHAAEEAEELLLIAGVLALLLPVMLAGAWWITRQLLAPLRGIIRAAEEIREGQLEQRIETDVAHDEIGQLARTINQAFDRYQTALRRLDRFSFDAAHQLRNPLAAIRTTGEVCLQHDRTPAEYRETIGQVLEDANRLSHTVDQLLTLARVSHSELADAFEPVELTALTREVIAEFQPLIDDKQIRLTTDLPAGALTVAGIPPLLREALSNLIDNAVRFTPEQGELAVRLASADADGAVWSVADSGPGLPAALREHLGRAPVVKGTWSREGTGLGLVIAADVVRAHRGRVTAETSPSGGAQFTIHLPLASVFPLSS